MADPSIDGGFWTHLLAGAAGALPGLFAWLRERRKTAAEARKVAAEAHRIDAEADASLEKIVNERITVLLSHYESELKSVRDLYERETEALRLENRQLEMKVERMEGEIIELRKALDRRPSMLGQ